MKERPILMSAPMVRPTLAGTKSQTRRVVKPQPYIDAQGNACWNGSNFGQDGRGPHIQALASPIPSSKTGRVRCPYGQPGDRLWVREAWKAHTTFDHLPPRDIPESHIWYMADDGYKAESRYRQGMFMPRWASRITLEVTGVRVERLQDISEADALAEGVLTWRAGWDKKTAATAFLHGTQARIKTNEGGVAKRLYYLLWEHINGAGSWDANPWVWVVEFKRVTP